MDSFSLFSQQPTAEEYSNDILTLYDLNNLVRQTIYEGMDHSYWVQAEISEAREVRGHCYMELIQKDENTATPIAKASAK